MEKKRLVRTAGDRVARDAVIRIGVRRQPPCTTVVWFSATSNVGDEVNDGAVVARRPRAVHLVVRVVPPALPVERGRRCWYP